MAKYEVGQVLFILAGASQGVVPVRICEEIKRKSLTNTTTDYLVNFPGHDEPVNLKQAKKHVFVSELDAKKYMMNNAEIAVDNLLKKASAIAKKMFDYPGPDSKASDPSSINRNVAAPTEDVKPEDNKPQELHPAEIEAEGTELVLADGMTARVHLPPEFQDLIGST